MLNPINWILFFEEVINFADESIVYWVNKK
jgi:hypothetical protein